MKYGRETIEEEEEKSRPYNSEEIDSLSDSFPVLGKGKGEEEKQDNMDRRKGDDRKKDIAPWLRGSAEKKEWAKFLLSGDYMSIEKLIEKTESEKKDKENEEYVSKFDIYNSMIHSYTKPFKGSNENIDRHTLLGAIFGNDNTGTKEGSKNRFLAPGHLKWVQGLNAGMHFQLTANSVPMSKPFSLFKK